MLSGLWAFYRVFDLFDVRTLAKFDIDCDDSNAEFFYITKGGIVGEYRQQDMDYRFAGCSDPMESLISQRLTSMHMPKYGVLREWRRERVGALRIMADPDMVRIFTGKKPGSAGRPVELSDSEFAGIRLERPAPQGGLDGCDGVSFKDICEAVFDEYGIAGG